MESVERHQLKLIKKGIVKQINQLKNKIEQNMKLMKTGGERPLNEFIIDYLEEIRNLTYLKTHFIDKKLAK